ncbi:lasso peptide biosynthesis PqqD family chaperone [Butyrivibrio sp. VCD2006]|uniref:lasso peptide biosynthesis PqqD family chaperone n=1 Tax=Butyrivibrio sp. VCD2006 TaxID=1280664 RepID=UPI0003FAC7B1|nr:lasso peptide biosynthesis PqqD family chaperone [Butyrivibrio sp. VCD2006]
MGINRGDIIKLKKNLNVTDLSGEKVMIDFESGKYFMIKGSGNDIWDLIQEEITVGDIIKKLLEEYDVSEEECEKSVDEFLTKLKEYEFI